MNAAELMSLKLYMELLFVGFILLTMLFVNNIVLYKQKISDRISIMLIAGMSMSAFEIIWSFCTDEPDLTMLVFISIYGYCISFVIFAAMLNRYLVERIGMRPRKIHIVVFYVVPVALFAVLTLTNNFTGLLVKLDENGALISGALFNIAFYCLVLTYIFSPLFIAVYYLTLGKNRKPADAQIHVSLFIFGIMAIALYYLQVWFIGDIASPYQTMSLPVSLSLVYLVTNVSTHTALDTQAHIEAVETDLRIASKIQADALPPVAPEFAEHLDLSLRGCMNTAKEVGGDFYDYFPIDENRICFLIADVSGKGTPAALFMMTAKTTIKDYALTQGSTSEIFTKVNARLCENNEEGMFATSWIGILDTRTMMLQYTNAGHNYPLFKRKGQPCEELKDLHGLFLAGLDFTRYKQSELQMEPGDRLLLYTDGVTEAHNKDKELYGTERLIDVVERTKNQSGEEVLEEVLADVNEYAAGVPQFDDITMINMTIKE